MLKRVVFAAFVGALFFAAGPGTSRAEAAPLRGGVYRTSGPVVVYAGPGVVYSVPRVVYRGPRRVAVYRGYGLRVRRGYYGRVGYRAYRPYRVSRGWRR
jgi:hypothetical protein